MLLCEGNPVFLKLVPSCQMFPNILESPSGRYKWSKQTLCVMIVNFKNQFIMEKVAASKSSIMLFLLPFLPLLTINQSLILISSQCRLVLQFMPMVAYA